MEPRFMQKAIDLSRASVESGGGPFGAVIVRDGKIVGHGVNSVTLKNDPTAHAEVSAIRNACNELGTFNLEGCEIYTSCEPCPMCLSAIYWARIDKIYYGNTRKDAADIGFSDDFIYSQIGLAPDKRSIPALPLLHEEAIKTFKLWQAKTDKIEY